LRAATGKRVLRRMSPAERGQDRLQGFYKKRPSVKKCDWYYLASSQLVISCECMEEGLQDYKIRVNRQPSR